MYIQRDKMGTRAELIKGLKALRLSGVLESLDLRLKQAQEGELDCLEFFELLVQDEIERRNIRRLQKRLKAASFEEEKTIETFDFSFNPKIPKARIRELLSCHFIDKKEHVIFCGPTGVGKTHLAQAIGHQACRLGYAVLFVKARKMFRALYKARADGSWEGRIKNYVKPDLLIIDDFGLNPFKGYEAEDIYEIVCERYQKGSMILTSNRLIADWLSLFPDPLLGNSVLDRLAHQAYQIVIEGESYRRRQRVSVQEK